jgi:hypothetical protein
MNFLEQLDDFWREGLQSGGGDKKRFERKYADFVKRVQDQVSHLPQGEQDRLAMQLVNRNAEYIAIAKRDRDALKVRLGLSASSAATGRLAQVAAETVVRATIWQSIAALFRGFR